LAVTQGMQTDAIALRSLPNGKAGRGAMRRRWTWRRSIRDGHRHRPMASSHGTIMRSANEACLHQPFQ
jgi:hypothetical protein